MSKSARQYDLVLFGATGYTGKLSAEHILKSLPTDLVWAIAGRSREKLQAVTANLKKKFPDRREPAIEVVPLKHDELHALAKNTKVLINTVGPYALYGEPVVEACASQGCHYIDCTGESPWTKDMIEKYDGLAKSTGAIIIPQAGVESAPSDVLTYAMTNRLYQETSQPTREAVVSLYDIKGETSGGTLATVFNIFDTYSLAQIQAATQPGSVTPLAISRPIKPASLLSIISGVTTVPDLGILTTSIQASADVPLVHRSWGLYRSAECKPQADAYGPQFRFFCHMNSRNIFTGTLVHLALTLSSLFLLIPPIRWLLAKLVTQPGSGPSEEDGRKHFVEYRGVAVTAEGHKHQKVSGKWYFQGSMYVLTAITMVEGAATLLYGSEDVPAKKMKGGLLTPSTLGDTYVERLRSAGVTIETRLLR